MTCIAIIAQVYSWVKTLLLPAKHKSKHISDNSTVSSKDKSRSAVAQNSHLFFGLSMSD